MAIYGTVQIYFTYVLAEKMKEKAGLWAAAICALYAPFIYGAHEIIGDTLQTVLLTLVMIWGTKYIEADTRKKQCICVGMMAVFTALAMLEKWNGAAGMGLIAIVVLVQRQPFRKEIGQIAIQAGVALGAFMGTAFLMSPNICLDIGGVYENLRHLTRDYGEEILFGRNLKTYVFSFSQWAGILTTLFAICGLIILIVQKSKRLVALSIAPIMLIGMSIQTRAFIRWGFCAHLVLIVLAAVGIVSVKEIVRLKSVKAGLCVLITVGLINVGLTGMSETLTYAMKSAYSLTQSYEWLLERKADQTDCIYDIYTCWAPTGASLVPREMTDVDSHLSYIDGRWQIDRLGRSYALFSSKCEEAYIEDMVLETVIGDVPYTSLGFVINGEFGPYYNDFKNIRWRIHYIREILAGNLVTTTKPAYIYNISHMPQYQVFEAASFTRTDPENQVIYSTPLLSIYEGDYLVTIEGDLPETLVFQLTDSAGNVCAASEFIDGTAKFHLPADIKNANIELINPIAVDFGRVKIETVK